jgi:hypothetical protein
MDTVRREVRVRDFGFGGAHGWASCMAVRAAGGLWAEAHAPVPDTRVFDGVQYSRPGPVSNKKQETAPGLEGREGTPWL